MPPKRRVQVRDPLEAAAPKLQPRARAVDTFVTPSNAAPFQDNRLDDLGRALQGINQSLVSTAVSGADLKDKADFARATSDHRKNTQNINAAVDAGMIPFTASPAYLRGLAAAQLGSLGTKFRSEMHTAFQGSEALNSDNPEAVQNFVREFQSGFAEKHLGAYDDLDIANYYEQAEIKAIKELQANHTNARLAAKARAGENVLTQKASDVLSAYHSIPEDKRDVAALTAALARIVDPSIETNLTYLRFPMRRANKAIIIATIESAIAFDDITMLDAIRNVPTGNGGRLGEIADYKKLLRVAEDEIVKNEVEDVRTKILMDSVKVTAVTIKAISEVNTLLAKGDYQGARDVVLNGDLNKFNPKQARAALNDITARERGDSITRVTSAELSAIFAEARGPGMDLAGIQRLAARTPLGSIDNLYRHWDTMRTHRGYYSDPTYKRVEREMQSIFTAASDPGTRAALAAQRDLIPANNELEASVTEFIVEHDGKVPTLPELRELMQVIADSPRFGLLVLGAKNKDTVIEILADAESVVLNLVPGHAAIVRLLLDEVKALDVNDSFTRRYDKALELAEALKEGNAAQRDIIKAGTQTAIGNQPGVYDRAVMNAKDAARRLEVEAAATGPVS